MPSRTLARVHRRRAALLGLLLGVFCEPAMAVRPPERSLLERILAVVDETPVLSSEVETLRRLRGLEPDAALQAVIDETLMLREAIRLPEAAISPEEESKALESLGRAPGTHQERTLPEAALRALARREATILKYVELRFRPQLRVEAEAVFRAYEEQQSGAASARSFETTEPEIREQLQTRALDERIEAWVKELRAAARIRLNPP